jgi:hypothetical protein
MNWTLIYVSSYIVYLVPLTLFFVKGLYCVNHFCLLWDFSGTDPLHFPVHIQKHGVGHNQNYVANEKVGVCKFSLLTQRVQEHCWTICFQTYPSCSWLHVKLSECIVLNSFACLSSVYKVTVPAATVQSSMQYLPCYLRSVLPLCIPLSLITSQKYLLSMNTEKIFWIAYICSSFSETRYPKW